MNNNEIKQFTKGDIISIIFVLASVINIIASDKEKEYLFGNDIKDMKDANTIYIFVLLILLGLYIYFVKSNYQSYQNNNSQNNLVRLYGSIFLLIGGLCFLYYRINDRNSIQNNVEL